jgi:hypothetical protein
MTIKTKDRDGADLNIAAIKRGDDEYPVSHLADAAGVVVDPAKESTVAALLTAAQAIRAAAEALNGKATAINTGAVAGTVAVSNFPAATGLTDAQLRATPVPVSGTFWQATQPVSFTWAGLTDAQLRAAPLALSVGAATEAKQDVANTSLEAIDLDLSTMVGLANAVLTSYSVAGVIAASTVLATVDCINRGAVSVHCVAMGTAGVVTPEWSNNNTDWLPATMFTAAGASATTFNAAGLWVLPVAARYLRLRLSTATTAGTTTLSVQSLQQRSVPWLATQPVTHAGGLAAGTARVGFVAGSGIWYDDTGTALGANATFTGTSRDATVTATATAFANAATYAQEVRVAAEADQSGTLWLEVSRDGTTWRRAKSVATAAVTGGAQYAEIVHRPSWRYWRTGFTNGATAQTRLTVGSIALA